MESGPDRVRIRSAEIRLQTYTTGEDFSGLLDNNDRLTINSNGNVGIGTTTPSTRLEVNGTTKTNSIQVGSNTTSVTTIGGIMTGNANFGASGGAAFLDVTISFTSPTGSGPLSAIATWKRTQTHNDAFVIALNSSSSTQVVFRVYRVDSTTKTWGDGQSFNYIIMF